MILINLLPHREESASGARRVLRRAGNGLRRRAWSIAALWYLVLQQMTASAAAAQCVPDRPRSRSSRSRSRTSRRCVPRSTRCKARQKAVEDLQTDRNIPVHLLNELVKQTPEGIYYSRAPGQTRQVVIADGRRPDQRACLRTAAQHGPQLEWLDQARSGRDQGVLTCNPASRDQRRLFDFSMRVEHQAAAGRRADAAASARARLPRPSRPRAAPKP